MAEIIGAKLDFAAPQVVNRRTHRQLATQDGFELQPIVSCRAVRCPADIQRHDRAGFRQVGHQRMPPRNPPD